MSNKKHHEYNRLYANLNIRDREDNKSIVSMVPSWLATAINAIPNEVLCMSEEEVTKICSPSALTKKLRFSFWEEYHRVSDRDITINISNICGGLCDTRVFRTLCGNSFTLAYILMAPIEVHVAMEEMLHIALDEIKSILNEPLHDDNGKFNPKTAMTKVVIWRQLMDRRRGEVRQPLKLQGEHLHVHQQLTSTDMEKAIEQLQPPNHERGILEEVAARTPMLALSDVEEV